MIRAGTPPATTRPGSGLVYACSAIVAEAEEKIVPNSIVADGAHRGSVRERNARLRYWPHRPGRSAQAWVEASNARSTPTIRLRSAHEQTDGVTSTQQI